MTPTGISRKVDLVQRTILGSVALALSLISGGRFFFTKNSFVLHVSENVIIYTCHWFIGPSRNKPFGSEFSDSNRKSGKVDYVTDNIVGHWPVFTVLLSSRLCPIYLAALTLLNIIGLCRVSSPGGIMARGTEETLLRPGDYQPGLI